MPALLSPSALGPPCPSPRWAVRVGAVPRPRLRPLADVLAALAHERESVPEPPAPVPDLAPDLDLAAAARPAAVRLFGAVAEILDGRRPPAHLRGLCDADLYAGVVAGLAPARRSASQGRVRGVRVCAVTPVAAEASAVVHRDGRARAVAARLERVDGAERTWRVTALVVG